MPETYHMTVSVLNNLLRLAEKGAVIIFQKLPADVPGFGQLVSRRENLKSVLEDLSFTNSGRWQEMKTGDGGRIILSDDVTMALPFAGVKKEGLTERKLNFTRRVIGDDTWYFLVNHTAETIDGPVPLNVDARSVILLDPQNGRYGMASFSKEKGKISVKLDLKAGESMFVCATGRNTKEIDPWKYEDYTGEVFKINGPWKLTFTSGGPFLPVSRNLDSLVSWTALSDSTAACFSGTAEYTMSFNMDNLTPGDYILDPGDVRESARVWVNGQDVGIAWGIPTELQIGTFLHSGRNTLKIEVANLMANRIIYMDRHGLQWRNFHEINFVNLEYKPFDASGWEWMPSGLLGPVKIVHMKKDNQ